MLKKTISLVALTWVILALAVGCVMSSCQVLKGKSEERIDSTRLAKKDSGAVSVNTNAKSDSAAYRREIWTFGRDTNVTINNIYPTSYTRESGERHTTETVLVYDSSWKVAYDSLNQKVEKVEKSKETKVATNPLLWIIGGAVLLMALKMFLPFKIVKS